jgi:pullulanase
MGCHDIETMNEIRKAVDEIDPTIFIYGEGWSAGACALPNEQLGMKANIPQMPGIAAFSDDLRDALRGPFSDDTKPGWLVRAGHDKCEADMGGLQESIKAGIAGMIAHPQVDYSMVNYSKEPYALEPTQMMAYVSCHDDMCLVDRLKASAPGISNDELIRLDLLAQTAVFTSQGVPFMLSGEELLRTKLGVHNSFESPDSINHLDWSNKTSYPQVFDYYRGLIQLRRDHPLFRLGSADLVRQCLSFLDTPDDVVAYRLTKQAAGDAKDDGSAKDNGSAKDSPLAGEPWQSIVVVLNASSTEQTIAIPNGQYTMVCANGRIDLSASGITTVSGDKVKVAPQSAVILHD